MGKILVIKEPRVVIVEENQEIELKEKEIRLEALYSGISAGTELTLYRGENPFLSKKWNNDSRIFEDSDEPSWKFPFVGGVGYEGVGRVIEIGDGVSSVKIGDVIYGAWGHRSSVIVKEEYAVDHKLPEELDPICGIFAQIGSIALNAILDANIHVGETVVVFGQGVPGQIVTQLAKLNGATVVAVDLDDSRLEFSKKFGADYTFNPNNCNLTKEIKHLTNNRGADVCIEIAGSTIALNQAVKVTAYSGKVVCSGFFQGNAEGLYLGEEFHHNRINIVCSQISGVSPGLSNRWNRVRMDQTIMEYQRNGKLDLKSLISHVIPFSQCQYAFDILDTSKEKCLEVVLQF